MPCFVGFVPFMLPCYVMAVIAEHKPVWSGPYCEAKSLLKLQELKGEKSRMNLNPESMTLRDKLHNLILLLLVL